MKHLKRMSAFLLAMLMAFSVQMGLSMKADAQSMPCITVESGVKSADENGTIQVSVCITDNPGFTYGYLQIGWDETALELQGIRSDMAGVRVRREGSLMELAPDNDSVNVTTSGPLFTMTFRVLKTGDTTVSLNYKNGKDGRPNHKNLTNCNAEGVDVIFTDGAITVTDAEAGGFDPQLREVSGRQDTYQITIAENVYVFLTGYQQGKMLFCSPIHLAESGAADHCTCELTVPQNGADCVKLLFMDEYWRPLGTRILRNAEIDADNAAPLA